MKDVDYRKFQEAVANLIKIKDEIATSLWELFNAYVQKGFTREEALKLVIMQYQTSCGNSND